jgi:hypothetical protein
VLPDIVVLLDSVITGCRHSQRVLGQATAAIIAVGIMLGAARPVSAFWWPPPEKSKCWIELSAADRYDMVANGAGFQS